MMAWSYSLKMSKIIYIFLEIIGWLLIAGSVTIGFGLIALLIYSKTDNAKVSIAVLLIGFILGAIWATRIAIKGSTMEYLSRIARIT